MKEFRWGKEEGLEILPEWNQIQSVLKVKELLKGHCIWKLAIFHVSDKKIVKESEFGEVELSTEWVDKAQDHKGPNLSIGVSFLIMNLDFIWLEKKKKKKGEFDMLKTI